MVVYGVAKPKNESKRVGLQQRNLPEKSVIVILMRCFTENVFVDHKGKRGGRGGGGGGGWKMIVE